MLRRRLIALAFLVVAPPALGREPSDPRVAWSLDLAAHHDDNILQMTPAEIRRLEDGPPSSRFRVTTPDDRILTLHAAVTAAFRPMPRRETRLDFSGEAHRYATNGVKDWQALRLQVRQELTASRRHGMVLRVWSSWIPSYYLREVTDDDASFAAGRRVRTSSEYGEQALGFGLEREMVEGRLDASVGHVRASRDYDAALDERDGVLATWRLGLAARPFAASRLRVRLDLRSGGYTARGDLAASPIVDDDISYDMREVQVGLAIPWGQRYRGRFEASAELEDRRYTTANPFDLSRFHRRDDRRDWDFTVVQRIAPSVDLVATFERNTRDTTLPEPLDDADDVTGFRQTRVGLGVSWSPR